MSREQALMQMLEANVKIQWNVAMILEAKAVEAEKVRNWILNHVHEHSYADHEKQLSDPLEVHEQMVEIIEGLTKLQSGLCSNLKTILPQEEGSSGDGGDFGGGLFSGSFDLGDEDK